MVMQPAQHACYAKCLRTVVYSSSSSYSLEYHQALATRNTRKNRIFNFDRVNKTWVERASSQFNSRELYLINEVNSILLELIKEIYFKCEILIDGGVNNFNYTNFVFDFRKRFACIFRCFLRLFDAGGGNGSSYWRSRGHRISALFQRQTQSQGWHNFGTEPSF